MNMVLTGKIRDAKTISSVLWLDHVSRTKAHARVLVNAARLKRLVARIKLTALPRNCSVNFLRLDHFLTA